MPQPPEDPIFHLALPEDWAAAQGAGLYRMSTRGRSLEEVGFIHCSHAEQVAETAQRIFRGAGPLLVLTIDPSRVGAEVREEGGFPHIYGPLPVAAVTAVTPFSPP